MRGLQQCWGVSMPLAASAPACHTTKPLEGSMLHAVTTRHTGLLPAAVSLSAGLAAVQGSHPRHRPAACSSGSPDGFLCMQALLLYEEAIPDTAQQRVALAAMTGALQRARLPADSRAALVAKATAYAARLLRRADQCRAVLACSHMHWQVRLSCMRALLQMQCGAGGCAGRSSCDRAGGTAPSRGRHTADSLMHVKRVWCLHAEPAESTLVGTSALSLDV